MTRETVMDHDYFNPKTYQVIDRVTGEEINVDFFIEKTNKNTWQKAYAKTLAEYIQCGDGKAVNLLAYIIKEKDINNMVHGTQRELAKNASVSLDVVTRTMRALQAKKLIKKVRAGCYMVSPDVMSNGSTKRGVIMMRAWGDI